MKNLFLLFLLFVQAVILALSLKGLGETVGLALEKRLYWEEEFKLKKCALVDAANRNLKEAVWTLDHKYRESGEVHPTELKAALSASADDLIAGITEYYGDQLVDCPDKQTDYEVVLERHEGQPQHWPNWVYRRRLKESLF